MSEVVLSQYITALESLLKRAYKTTDSIIHLMERHCVNLFEALNLDENKITLLLKYFLTYQQNNKFLFLQRFILCLNEHINEKSYIKTILTNLKDEDFEETYIASEYTIDNGRIDLFLKIKNFVIAIENKVGAKLTGDQIKRYYEYLQMNFKDFLLVLLCDNEEGYKWSKKWLYKNADFYYENNYLILTYERLILPWLKECKKLCNNEKIQFFIQEFENFLKKRFNIMEAKVKEAIDELTQFLKEECYKNKHFYQTIQIFQIAVYYFLRELYETFSIDLTNLAHKIFGKDYSIEGNLNWDKYSRISIFRDEWSNKGEPFFGIGIEAIEEYISALKVGIWINPKSEHYEKFKEKYSNNIEQIRRLIPEHKSDEWWISFKYISLKDFIESNIEIKVDNNGKYKCLNCFLVSPIFVEFYHNKQAYESLLKEISKLLTIYKNYIESI